MSPFLTIYVIISLIMGTVFAILYERACRYWVKEERTNIAFLYVVYSIAWPLLILIFFYSRSLFVNGPTKSENRSAWKVYRAPYHLDEDTVHVENMETVAELPDLDVALYVAAEFAAHNLGTFCIFIGDEANSLVGVRLLTVKPQREEENAS